VTEVTGVGQAGPAPQTGGRERRWVPTIRRGSASQRTRTWVADLALTWL
jgi:hypothetical protein